ncbi:hypothetical protein NDU88_004184 [Pleurodeles waltl]|uniref:Uncharacterized protein n=1 Tax=Pleurodeles waltl TaxID=8319 RepID=A0AAV7RI00_PLEWA|nr:hypothetical protein NDU88_004184 [Pleurodeles waltl]
MPRATARGITSLHECFRTLLYEGFELTVSSCWEAFMGVDVSDALVCDGGNPELLLASNAFGLKMMMTNLLVNGDENFDRELLGRKWARELKGFALYDKRKPVQT